MKNLLHVTIPLFWKGDLHIKITHAERRDEHHFGIGNRCADGLYIVFLDYDKTPLEWVRAEITYLQDTYGLGSAYLFETKNGFHVVFLDKLELDELITIMGCTSIDKRYMSVPLKYARRCWVLRQTPKKGEEIHYSGVYHSGSARELSEAHAIYLVRYGGVPPTDLNKGSWDRNKDIVLAYYTAP